MEIAIYEMKVQEIHFMIFKCNVDNKREKRSLWNEKEIVIWFKSNYNLFYLLNYFHQIQVQKYFRIFRGVMRIKRSPSKKQLKFGKNTHLYLVGGR